ncbi:hypothetical protein GEMRC1_013743 [Eukaryota sp. GEM-RC1]
MSRPMSSAGRALAEARASIGRPSLSGIRPLPPTQRPVTPASESHVSGTITPRPESAWGLRPSTKATARKLDPLASSSSSRHTNPLMQQPRKPSSRIASAETAPQEKTKSQSYEDKLSSMFSSLITNFSVPPNTPSFPSLRPNWDKALDTLKRLKRYAANDKTSHLFFSLHFSHFFYHSTFHILSLALHLSQDHDLIETLDPHIENLLDDHETESEKDSLTLS